MLSERLIFYILQPYSFPLRCKESGLRFGKFAACLANTFSPGPSFQNYSAPSGLVKSFAPYKGLRPLLLISPLRGLNHQTSFAGRRTSSVRLPTSSAGSRASSEIRNPPLGGRVLKPTSLYPLLFLIITPGNRPGRSCRLNPVNIMPGNQLLKIMATFAIGSKIVYSKIF